MMSPFLRPAGNPTVKRISDSVIRDDMTSIFAVETAATGPRGFPMDKVVQIAICEIRGGEYETVFAEHVQTDPRDLGKEPLDYLSENYGIHAEDLYSGVPEEFVVGKVQGILVGQECVSFDVGEVFGRHLSYEPWNLAMRATLLPSLDRFLPAAATVLPDEDSDPLRKAYDVLCPGDPAEVGEGKGAPERARMTASVVSVLTEAGLFRSGRGRAQERPDQVADIENAVEDCHRYGQDDVQYRYGRRHDHQEQDEGEQPDGQQHYPRLGGLVVVQQSQP